MAVSDDDFVALTPLGENKGRAAVIWARDELGRSLLQIRDNFDFVKMKGRMGYFGGHVEEGEALDVCAAREFAEETGIEIETSDLVPRVCFVSPTNDQMLHFVFELKRRIHPTEVVIHEGAGFVFLDPCQFKDFPVLPAVTLAQDHLETHRLGAA